MIRKNFLLISFYFGFVNGNCLDEIESGKKMAHSHRYEEALHHFESALKDHLCPQQIYEIGNNMLAIGNAYYSSGHMEQSQKVFKRLSEMFPDSSTVIYNYGMSCH